MSTIINNAIRTFQLEAEAISNLANQLTDDYEKAVNAILACNGKVIVTGMGKSGIIGKKIAATLASTGTSAFFLHPGEAYHGDLGMISPIDVIIAISNSGQTDEILKLIPFLEENKNIIISMTGNPLSTLAVHSHFHLNIAVKEEACPLKLAPTTSTTAAVVMGDALAISLMKERNFNSEDYARYHPGGNLGRRLLTRVKDKMRKENLPCVPSSMTIGEIIFIISKSRMGMAVVTDKNKILGVVTDGDIRRSMEKDQSGFLSVDAKTIMSKSPKVISPEARINEAEEVMRQNKIHSLLVTDQTNELLGILEFYDVSVFE
jgi:arabinose-5-phosphate isomerase